MDLTNPNTIILPKRIKGKGIYEFWTQQWKVKKNQIVAIPETNMLQNVPSYKKECSCQL